MVVSSRAWHVRLVRRYKKGYTPRNLCSHFWFTVSTVVLSIVLALLSPVIGLVWLGTKGTCRVDTIITRWHEAENKRWKAIEYTGIGLLILLGIAGVASVLFFVVIVGYWFVTITVPWLVERWRGISIIAGSGLAVIPLGYGIAMVATNVWQKYVAGREPHPPRSVKPPKAKKEHGPNQFTETIKLLFAWLWAKKQRVCPLITLVD